MSRPCMPSHNALRAALGLLIAMILTLPAIAVAAEAITQPLQPATGPGGSDYPFAAVERAHVGDEPEGAWVFTPRGATPEQLDSYPVVLFVHGFLAIDPEIYGGWIAHLVRRGNIVIYPDYQTRNPLADPPDRYVANLFAGTRAAIQHLQESGATSIRDKRFHVVGHSLGGLLAVRYAQEAGSLDFPPARTLMVVQPGGCAECGTLGDMDILERPLPSDLLAQVLVGSDDTTVGDADARAIWPLLQALPVSQRDYVTVRSDAHGTPPLDADHEMVGTTGARGEENAMDWYALWRPFDALIACAETGEDCAIALGDTPEHRDMGRWSDGTPVTPLQITDGPP